MGPEVWVAYKNTRDPKVDGKDPVAVFSTAERGMKALDRSWAWVKCDIGWAEVVPDWQDQWVLELMVVDEDCGVHQPG